MYEKAYGSKYKATQDLDIAEVAKLVRKDIAQAVKDGRLPAGTKARVTIDRFSGGQSMDVRITEFMGQVRNPTRLAFETANPHSHTNEPILTEGASAAKKVVESIVGAYNFDGSDIQTDYFHVRFYGGVEFDHVLTDRDRALFRGEPWVDPRTVKAEVKPVTGDVAFKLGKSRRAYQRPRGSFRFYPVPFEAAVAGLRAGQVTAYEKTGGGFFDVRNVRKMTDAAVASLLGGVS